MGRALRAASRCGSSLRRPGDELGDPGLEPDDDAAGGGCGGLLQASHGADAALERLSRTGPLGRDQRIDTTGRIRPLWRPARAGRPGPIASSPGAGAAARGRGGAAPSPGPGRPGTSTVVRRPSRRSRARGEARTKRAAGRAAYFAAMLCCMSAILPCQDRVCKGGPEAFGNVRCQRATLLGERRSRGSAAARYSGRTSGRVGGRAPQVGLERPDVAARHRAGQGRPDPERPGVAERLLDQRPVDRERRPPRRGRRPGRARRSRRAARRSRRRRAPPPRGRPPSCPGARRTACAPIASAISASRATSWSSPSTATVAPWSAATARSVSAKATSGWKLPTWVPAAIAGSRTSAPSAPLVWTSAWPLYSRIDPASGAMASSGTARMISSTSSRSGVTSAKARVPPTSSLNRSRRTGSRLATAADRPAGPGQGQPERRSDRAGPDDPDDRRLAGVRVLVRVGVVVRRRRRRDRGPGPAAGSSSMPGRRAGRRPSRRRVPRAGSRSRQALIVRGTLPSDRV